MVNLKRLIIGNVLEWGWRVGCGGWVKEIVVLIIRLMLEFVLKIGNLCWEFVRFVIRENRWFVCGERDVFGGD